MHIKSLNLEIINICNLRCSICDIWKNKNKNFLDENAIETILKSNYISQRTDITITGGEPMLYENIKNIVDIFIKYNREIKTLSTNGTIQGKLHDFLEYLQKRGLTLPNIHISIDGFNETHDHQRGVKNSFKKSIYTTLLLKKSFPKINIKFKYTITGNNIKDITKIYILSKKIGVDIGFKIVENDINYTNRISKPETLNQTERDIIYKIIDKLYPQKNLYIENLLFYIKHGEINFTCKTPEKNIFIMANGEIFACTHYKSIGNIHQDNIDNILFGGKHKNLIKKIEKNNCKKCFSAHGSYKTNN